MSANKAATATAIERYTIAATPEGVGIQIPFANTALLEGPVASALNGTDISRVVGLCVTIPLYYFVGRARISHEQPAVARAGPVSA
jgi:hypothetical protein